ncbi:MAG: hypothetical protein JWP12_1561 [Bacteroidetes bacterium]|nr:hypothetical protein [Bacteroidota bacterium]
MNTFLTQIVGTWFIIGTNFPMWLKGDKQSPSFTYTVTQHKGKEVLLDEVKYLKKGKTKTITGYDRADETKQNAFVWRGKGLLAIAKSNWEIKLIDPQGNWVVIWFSKTLFTPEGIDIISRRQQLDEATLLEIKNKITQDPVLKKQLETLKILK